MTPRILTGRQEGLVMVIALIMLLAVTLMVVAASNLVNANLKVVQNMEIRDQARAVTLAAIEEAISNGTADNLPRFIETPDDVFRATCDGTTLTCSKLNNVKKYDTNGDGIEDITVSLSEPVPRCVLGRPKLENELRSADRAYRCSNKYTYGTGGDGNFYSITDEGGASVGDSADSRCGETIWEFNAVAQDLLTGAEVLVRQGVGVTVTKNAIIDYCGDEEEPEV